MRWSVTLFLIIFSLVAETFSCKKETFQIPDFITQEFVDLGTHKLATISFGSGEHTIVFENGLGTEMIIWVEPGIFEAIGANNQVIGYNRGGYDTSESGPKPRDIPRLISELDQIIDAKSVNDKVILVGHSLGGAFIRSYAVMNPDKVEGLLFIESSHEDFLTLVQADEDELVNEIRKDDPERIGTIMEAMQLIENSEYLDTLPNLPDIPTIAMVSTKLENGITPGYVAQWISVQESLGEGLSDFKLITTENSGHQIHVDEPGLVIDAIEELINK